MRRCCRRLPGPDGRSEGSPGVPPRAAAPAFEEALLAEPAVPAAAHRCPRARVGRLLGPRHLPHVLRDEGHELLVAAGRLREGSLQHDGARRHVRPDRGLPDAAEPDLPGLLH